MLYKGTNPAALYRGAYKPGALYKGAQLIAGYADAAKAAPAAWDGTYDDIVSVTAQGRGKQQTYNGRNLFDPSWLAGLAGWSQVGDVYSGPMSAANTAYGSGTGGFPIAFEDGKQYAIQYYTQAEAETQMAKFVVTYTDGTLAPLPLSTVSRQFVSLITAAGKTVAKIWFSYSADGVKTIAFDHVQVSQGTEITAYEPYVGGKPSPSPDYPQPLVAAEGTLTASGRTGTTPTTVTLPVLMAIPGSDIRDEMAYIGGGQWRVTRRVGVISSYAGESVGNTWASSTGQLTTGAVVWYALATFTTETVTLGTLPSYPVHTELAVSGDFPPDVTGTVKVSL